MSKISAANISRLEKKAFEENDVNAQIELARIYSMGDSVEPDLQKASICFLKAARNGHAGAIRYITKEAENGEADWQHNLAVMYETGEGVNQDIRLALYFYTLAAQQGVQESVDKLIELDNKINISENNPEFKQILSDILKKHSQ